MVKKNYGIKNKKFTLFNEKKITKNDNNKFVFVFR